MRSAPHAPPPRAGGTDDHYRLLVESVKDYGIFILDPGGHITTWNEGAQRIKGYSAAEIIGKHFSIFYPAEDVAAGKCERELAIALEEGRFEEEGWRLRKDGTRFWANVTITALRLEGGEHIGFAKVTRDLTERKAAEAEARRFRLLVESVRDYGIFILDPTGHVVTWNAGAERLKGYVATEIVGKHFSVFYPAADVAAGKCEHELHEAAREGRFEDEGWRIRKDGSRFWANVIITALHSDQGELVGFAKVTRDLTERKQLEERQRALAAEEAAVAERARVQEFQERFLAILGHDLRNPLAAIDMGAGLLRQQTAGDPAMARVADRMRSSSRRMSRMIEQILDLTRSRLGGGLEVARQPMELCAMLTGIVEELRTVHPSRSIELACAPPIGGTWDRDRLEQVFSNLVSNALHYGAKDAPVAVKAHLDGAVVGGAGAHQGEPIPEPLRVSLFNPFRRGERDSRTKETEGLGLGLYISREIVLAHGGDIQVRSTPSEGTTFRVTLPTGRGPST
jgi:PAS domain S-box-containing protein